MSDRVPTQQQQVHKVLDKQVEQEIQYYVFQDLANVLGVLADTQESIKHFKNQQNHPYIPMALNRLTLQVNLSNGILFDQQLTHQEKNDHQQFFKSSKQEAKKFFEEIIREYKLDTSNQHVNNCVSHYLEKNLADVTEFKALQPPKYVSPQKSEFNQKVVQNIFNGMQQVDQQMNLIAEGKYEKLTKEQILEQTKNRAVRARLLLSQNFPQQVDQPKEQTQPAPSEPLPQPTHQDKPLPQPVPEPLTQPVPQEEPLHYPSQPQTQPLPSEQPLPKEQPLPEDQLNQEKSHLEQELHQHQPPEQPIPKNDDEEANDIPEDTETNKPQENKQPILKAQLNEGENKQEIEEEGGEKHEEKMQIEPKPIEEENKEQLDQKVEQKQEDQKPFDNQNQKDESQKIEVEKEPEINQDQSGEIDVK